MTSKHLNTYQVNNGIDSAGRRIAGSARDKASTYRLLCFVCRVEFRVWQTRDDVFYVMFDKVQSHSKFSEHCRILTSPLLTSQIPVSSFQLSRSLQAVTTCYKGGFQCLYLISQRTSGARKDGSKISNMQRVDQYPIASEFINKMMSLVMDTVRKEPALKRKLFQASFQDSLSGEAMVRHSESSSYCCCLLRLPRRQRDLLAFACHRCTQINDVQAAEQRFMMGKLPSIKVVLQLTRSHI